MFIKYFLLSLQRKNIKIMEDKHYPILDEEESGLMVEESAVAVAPAPVAMEICHDFIADSVPHTLEDAIADLEEGEREFERGETFSHKEVMQMIWDKIHAYAG